MAITFKVDPVERSAQRLPTKPLASQVGECLFLSSPEVQSIDYSEGHVTLQKAIHPLVGAVHLAFGQHRSLVLSPDVIWLTILQGVAQHIRLHANELQGQLVNHTGKKPIVLDIDQPLPQTSKQWTAVVEDFSEKIASDVNSGLGRTLLSDFSTTTNVEKVASQIMVLDALSPYYDLYLVSVCGIPEVTLLGTPSDWRLLLSKVSSLSVLRFPAWVDSLTFIGEKLLQTAEGKPDIQFWKEIYKPAKSYGNNWFCGWLARLFPYLKNGSQGYNLLNPMLSMSHEETMKLPQEMSENRFFYKGPGITTASPALGMSSVQLNVHFKGTDERLSLAMEGGLLAVEQDKEGRLIPRAGFLVRKSKPKLSFLLEEIKAHHQTTPNQNPIQLREGTAELNEIVSQWAGATLFAESSPWYIRSAEELQKIHLKLGDQPKKMQRIIDLPDGSCLALESVPSKCWVLRFKDVSKTFVAIKNPYNETPDFEYQGERLGVSLVGHSIEEVLRWALANHGSPHLPEVGSLEEIEVYWNELMTKFRSQVVSRPPAKKPGFFSRLWASLTRKSAGE
jgi:hypothetical protein